MPAAHPSVTKVWADGGYQTSVIQHGADLGIDVEVVQRPKEKGFQPLPKRWVIERTFGWLMQHRRLARDYEALPQRSRTMIHWVMAANSPEHPHQPGESKQTSHPHRREH
nr:transposase [Streptomyces alfalfae]